LTPPHAPLGEARGVSEPWCDEADLACNRASVNIYSALSAGALILLKSVNHRGATMKWLLVSFAFVALTLCMSFFASIVDDLRKASDQN
jgi:hypothetical protein